MITKKRVIVVVLIILTLIATISKITHGFDIDEGYAISLGLRLLKGDRLIVDLWDPYQFSAVFMVPFLKIYYNIFHSFEGIVFFTRSCSVLIQFITSMVIYLEFKKETRNNFFSFLLAIVFFNFLPKQIQNIDHAFLLMNFSILFLICFYEYKKNNKLPNLVGTSIFYCGMILAYPTQIIIFPIILVFLAMQNKNKFKHLSLFIITCCIFGVITIILVNPIELINNISNIMQDGSHDFTLVYHLIRIEREVLRVIFFSLPVLVVAYILNYITKTYKNNLYVAFTFILVFFGVVLLINLFGFHWPPLSLYMRYLLLSIIGMILVFKNKSKLIYIFVLSFIISIVCFFSSNNGIDSSSGFLIPSALLSLYLILNELSKKGTKNSINLAYLLIIVVLLSEIFVKYNSVRITGTIAANRTSVGVIGNGMLSDVYIQEKKQKYYNDVDKLLGYVDGNLIYCGSESFIFYDKNFNLITPTTTGTPIFNEQWIDYIENSEFSKGYLMIEINKIEDFFMTTPFGIYLSKKYEISIVNESSLNALYFISKR